jgi:hypothetical protein
MSRATATCLRWKILWEDEKEAAEFLEAFTRLLKSIGAEKIGEMAWAAGNRLVELQAEGRVTLIIISHARCAVCA